MLEMCPIVMLTLEPTSMGVHMTDFWSLEMLKVPAFLLYAAEQVIFDDTFEDAIFKVHCQPFSLRTVS